MSKFSVKKPFTILVMVIAMLILGGVSLSYMQMDLLPEMSLPYVLVITTYPGASPERVETTISEPMEASLGSVTGVKNVYSFSYENYSMVELEFQDDTDMEAVLVKIYTALDTVKSNFPDEVGTPNIMEISMDMMATQYLAVGYDGLEMDELSTFVDEKVTPALERQDGVARITSMGMIEKTVQIELNQDKVDDLNTQILCVANDALEEASEQLDDAKKQLEDGQAALNKSRGEVAKGQQELNNSKKELGNAKEQLKQTEDETYDMLASASLALDQLATYQAQLLSQQAELAALKAATTQINTGVSQGNAGVAGLTSVKGYVDACLTGDPATYSGDATATQTAIYALSQTGADTTQLSTMYQGYVTAVASGDQTAIATATTSMTIALSTTSTTLGAQIAATQTELDAANQTGKDYSAEISALELEIQVTEGIIAQYESQLKAMGVDYTDIEKAKMQASVGFATGEAQITMGEAQLESAQAQLDSAQTQLTDGQKSINEGWDSYDDAVKNFEEQKALALKNANASELLNLQTLSTILYAQNFAMPAGYIDDENDNSFMLKVGDNFETLEELEGLVLCNLDDIGDVTIKDVADVTIIDNSGETYTKLNGQNAVILSVFKASTAGTNEVSRACRAEIEKLEDQYKGLSIMVMMDQGDYITLIVNSVLQSMILGAILAIIVLAIFLKDVKPTIVVAISIPLSVLTSLVLMYFSDISLNIMSLSGMALGIGMLVDNSVVVIENIYRLRTRGVAAPKAAVQGTKQVAGAIIASTLTTVCVFLPMVYTSGYVRQLMLPMALTIIFCLMSSLVLAMTVVPAAGSTLLRNAKPKPHPLFDKIQDLYGEALAFCLKVKVVPLVVAIALLALSIWQIVRMGIVMIPEMTSNQIEASFTFEDELEREDIYAQMDSILNGTTQIDGVANVGVMTGGSASLISNMSDGDFHSFSMMVMVDEDSQGAADVHRICNEIESLAAKTQAEAEISTGMSEMGSMLGSGLSISIYGEDLDTLTTISHDIMDIMGQVEGFEEVSNGQEEADKNLHLIIDKNMAMSKGITVAQIYQKIAANMTDSATAISVDIDGDKMDVDIIDHLNPVTVENVLDTSFEYTEKDDEGNSHTKDLVLSEIATLQEEDGFTSIARQNQTHYITVSATVKEGENTTLLTREVEPEIQKYIDSKLPAGYTIDLGGEYDSVIKMVQQMVLVMLMGLAFIYLVMVAQFQSLRSPFIVLFTIPLAFTGGLIALWVAGENLSIISLMGFLVLMGTVVNNGIVFVDYANQLRIGGMERWDALIATGKTRMRPILMTALTTILAESYLIFGDDMGSQMGKGMALVIAGGLAYATLMTLFIIPVMYDILFKSQPLNVDTGDDDLDEILDDAAEYMADLAAKKEHVNLLDVTTDETSDAESTDTDATEATAEEVRVVDVDREDQ